MSKVSDRTDRPEMIDLNAPEHLTIKVDPSTRTVWINDSERCLFRAVGVQNLTIDWGSVRHMEVFSSRIEPSPVPSDESIEHEKPFGEIHKPFPDDYKITDQNLSKPKRKK